MTFIFFKKEKQRSHIASCSFLEHWESHDLETTNFKMIRFVLLT